MADVPVKSTWTPNLLQWAIRVDGTDRNRCPLHGGSYKPPTLGSVPSTYSQSTIAMASNLIAMASILIARTYMQSETLTTWSVARESGTHAVTSLQ